MDREVFLLIVGYIAIQRTIVHLTSLECTDAIAPSLFRSFLFFVNGGCSCDAGGGLVAMRWGEEGVEVWWEVWRGKEVARAGGALGLCIHVPLKCCGVGVVVEVKRWFAGKVAVKVGLAR